MKDEAKQILEHFRPDDGTVKVHLVGERSPA